MNKHIAHLSSVHLASDTRIFRKMCSSLAKDGYKVTLVARCDEETVIDGVRVLPFPSFDSKFKRFVKAPLLMFNKARIIKGIDVFHFHDPELILTGILLKLTGKKVIYDVHEDTPLTMATKDYLGPITSKLFYFATSFAEWLGGKFFDQIIVVIPSILKRFPKKKSTIIQNYALKDELSSKNITEQARNNTILYIGDITRVRGVKEAIQALGYVPDSLNASFVLGGRFSEEGLEDEIKQLPGWEKVRYLGYVDREIMALELSKAGIGVNLMYNRPDHYGAQPNKLFEYMSAGLPVIVSDFPMMNVITNESECGLAVNPLDVEEIAEAYVKILTNPELKKTFSKNGRKAIENKYNWESEYPKLVEIYKKVLR